MTAGYTPGPIPHKTALVGIDSHKKKWEIVFEMRPSATKRKKIDDPAETNGSRWAAAARKLANKLTPEQEAEHFNRAMGKVYGGQSKETTRAGR